jgi:trehalose-phosphatase
VDLTVASVQEAITARPPDAALVLLTDFDGTIAEFEPDPATPVLNAERRQWLVTLARAEGVFVGLVSGRRLHDLRRRAPVAPSVYYAGLHGMEIEIDRRSWRHPDLRRSREHVRLLREQLTAMVAHVPGVLVEDKDVSVALHVRQAPSERRWEAVVAADACARPWIAAGQLKRLEGSLVVEYLPNIACHKGDATRWIAGDVEARAGRPAWVVFIGDDVTDEDAFKAIDRGVGVLVGRRATAASHQLNGIGDVDKLLAWLAMTGKVEPS